MSEKTMTDSALQNSSQIRPVLILSLPLQKKTFSLVSGHGNRKLKPGSLNDKLLDKQVSSLLNLSSDFSS